MVRRAITALLFFVGCASSAWAIEPLPVVAVIDSGVAATPELKPLLIGEVDVASPIARQAYHPRYDHGTMVATILAHATGGSVRILSFRIDDPAGCPAQSVPPCQPSGAPIARAIRMATEAGVNAINLSLSLKDDASIASAVRDATGRGIRVVMAAGKQGLDHPANLRMAIAGYPHAVLVGALDVDGQAWSGSNAPGDHAAGRYNYVWQRGVALPSRTVDGTSVYVTGTSFAAPIETARLIRREPRAVLARAGASPSQTLR